MNLYYIRIDILDKETELVTTKDFAIPASTPEIALERSKRFGTGGVLQPLVHLLSTGWDRYEA